MFQQIQGTGPRGQFTALTGGGQGVPRDPGLRREVIPDLHRPAPQVFTRRRIPPPAPPDIYQDPYHSDLNVCRRQQKLYLEKVPKPIMTKIKRLLVDNRDISTDKVQDLIDRAVRGNLPVSSRLVQLIFTHHDVTPDMDVDLRLAIMVKNALDRLEAALYPKKDSSIEFPSRQERF